MSFNLKKNDNVHARIYNVHAYILTRFYERKLDGVYLLIYYLDLVNFPIFSCDVGQFHSLSTTANENIFLLYLW